MEPMASSSLSNILLDGVAYPVSPQFAAAVTDAMGTLSFDTAKTDAERLSLMHASNSRQLTASERQRVDFLTHVLNVDRAIKAVNNHHNPTADWGLDGWDAVHGNARSWPCGCEEHYVFDHHGATNHFGHNRMTDHVQYHPIEPRRVCKAHSQFTGNGAGLKKALEG